MKKLLCPIDFSEASKDGMEYASHLAKALEAKLSLLYVRTSIWPEAIQLKGEKSQSNEIIASKLTLMTSSIQKEFGISSDFHIQQTTDTFQDTVAACAMQYDLVVMGTNGADTLYQNVFGSHSFHVIEKSKCGVLIVPQGFSYRPLNVMVYAYDPETNPIFLIDQLKKLASPLGTAVKVLHISEQKPSEEANRKLEVLREAVRAREPRNISFSFDFKYAGDVAWTLDQYMKVQNADLLALSFHQRSLMDNLFKENVVKKISMVADYPVFVFWH